MKGATSRAPLDPPDEDDDGFGVAEFSAADIDWQGVVDMDLNEDGGMDLGPDENMGFTVPEDMPTNAGQAPSGGDLIDLGLFETLPPYEVMEDLYVLKSAPARVYLTCSYYQTQDLFLGSSCLHPHHPPWTISPCLLLGAAHATTDVSPVRNLGHGV